MNILITGVGGQGAVLASKILAQCAINRGEPAHTAETIGMAQRGGSVTSHVRLGDGELRLGDGELRLGDGELRLGDGAMSPLIPKGYADVIIGFEPAEAARNIDYLKPDGMLVVSNRAIQPSAGKPYDTAAVLGFLQDNTRVKIVDADEVFRATGSYRSLNIALLGVASRWGAIPFDVRELEAAMRGLMSERAVAASIPALTLGTESGSAGTV